MSIFETIGWVLYLAPIFLCFLLFRGIRNRILGEEEFPELPAAPLDTPFVCYEWIGDKVILFNRFEVPITLQEAVDMYGLDYIVHNNLANWEDVNEFVTVQHDIKIAPRTYLPWRYDLI